jgi:hypothetical protein
MALCDLQLLRDRDSWYVRSTTSAHASMSAQLLTLEKEPDRLAIHLETQTATHVPLLATHAESEMQLSGGGDSPLVLTMRLPAAEDCSMTVACSVQYVRTCLNSAGLLYQSVFAGSNDTTTIETDATWALPVWYWLHTKKAWPCWACPTTSWTATLVPATASDVDGRFSQCTVRTMRDMDSRASASTHYLDAHWTRILWVTRFDALRSLAAIDRQIERLEAHLNALATRRAHGSARSCEAVDAENDEEDALHAQLLGFVHERIRRSQVSTLPTLLSRSAEETLLCAAAEAMVHETIRRSSDGLSSTLPNAETLAESGLKQRGTKLLRIVGVALGWKVHEVV